MFNRKNNFYIFLNMINKIIIVFHTLIGLLYMNCFSININIEYVNLSVKVT